MAVSIGRRKGVTCHSKRVLDKSRFEGHLSEAKPVGVETGMADWKTWGMYRNGKKKLLTQHIKCRISKNKKVTWISYFGSVQFLFLGGIIETQKQVLMAES